MKRNLKIAAFGYFKQGRVTKVLAKKHDLEINSDSNSEISNAPDLVFFSDRAKERGSRYLGYDCLRIFFTAENVRPDFRLCDYAFSFEDTDDKNFQLPVYADHPFFEQLRTQRYSDEIKEFRKCGKSKFCAFLFSNPACKERIEFCKKLRSYKKVDCPGEVLNNMPRLAVSWRGEVAFFREYKFSIAFENLSTVHYTTEKIFRPLLVGCIPIYWGNPRVAEHFNSEAFINCHDYDDFDQVVKRVIEVDNDDALYQKYVSAPAVLEGSKAHAITEEAIMERLDKIVGGIGVVTPVAGRLSYKFRLPLHKLDSLQRRARYKLQLRTRLKRLISAQR